LWDEIKSFTLDLLFLATTPLRGVRLELFFSGSASKKKPKDHRTQGLTRRHEGWGICGTYFLPGATDFCATVQVKATKFEVGY
jgi:hypothetical protein